MAQNNNFYHCVVTVICISMVLNFIWFYFTNHCNFEFQWPQFDTKQHALCLHAVFTMTSAVGLKVDLCEFDLDPFLEVTSCLSVSRLGLCVTVNSLPSENPTRTTFQKHVFRIPQFVARTNCLTAESFVSLH